MESTKNSCLVLAAKLSWTANSMLFTRALASKCTMCSFFFQGPCLTVDQVVDWRISLLISGKRGSRSQPLSWRYSSSSRTPSAHWPVTSLLTNPADVRADSLALWPPERRKRSRSETLPIEATAWRSRRSAQTPKPSSLASDTVTTSFHGLLHSDLNKGMRPQKALSSLATLLHKGVGT